MTAGYLQPLDPRLPNQPIPPYPFGGNPPVPHGGPGFNPTFDGMFGRNLTTNPYINNTLDQVNMMQLLIYQNAGQQNAMGWGGQQSMPLQYLNNVINPMMANTNQIYQEAMGGLPASQLQQGQPGSGTQQGGGFNKGGALKHGLGGAVVGGAIGTAILPGVGTAIGGAIGGLAGIISGGIF